MPDHAARIYTRTGDQGKTGLSGGRRVRKDCPEIQAIGDVDELNSVIGMILAHDVAGDVKNILIEIQHQLFNLGAELSNPNLELIHADMVTSLEQQVDSFSQSLPVLKKFILPNGGDAASICHLARAVCRRAERSVVNLSQHQAVNPEIQVYLNRLSDFLFVTCRILSRHSGHPEMLWSSESQSRK
ncbi:MAG: cob(I)yrinic acid a,c-diamide adenosyltransferase [Gammaproteobacteria bacterium]|nr:cob(I)yrinic acid a,c-diamide adenosyltransferase [Gammaproteobacteria bacterium]